MNIKILKGISSYFLSTLPNSLKILVLVTFNGHQTYGLR